MGVPPISSMLIGVSLINRQFLGPLFMETHIYMYIYIHSISTKHGGLPIRKMMTYLNDSFGLDHTLHRSHMGFFSESLGAEL